MRWLVCLVCCALLGGCKEKHPDYKQVDDGLYVKLLAFDHQPKKPDSCDFYEVYLAVSDSVLSRQLVPESKDNVPNWMAANDERLKKLSRYLQHLNPGDSAVFIDERLSDLAASDPVVNVHLWWKKCYQHEEFLHVYNLWLEDRESREMNRIRKFALENGFISTIVHPDVLYRIEKSGDSERLSYGDEIGIRYSGHFLDGSPFDQPDSTAGPLVFQLGVEGQVLQGLEYGLIGAQPGEIRSVVIPSYFAFGEAGSSTRIVPPFTPVLYKVEVIETSRDSLSYPL